jgi:hypothetical protein
MNVETLRAAIPPDWLPWLGLALALVLAAALVEGLVLHARGHYDWRAFAATMGDLMGRRLIDGLGLSLAAPVLAWAWAHRIQTLELSTGASFLVLFLGQELSYYAYHRAAHRVRWFWASHAVHHSPNELTLAAAVRLGWTGKLTGVTLFFAPLSTLAFTRWRCWLAWP